jgi:CHAT domain-containing protein
MKVTFSDGDSSRVIRFTPAAYRTAYLQNLLLEDPLSRDVSREAQAALINEAGIYEGLLDQLAQFKQSGKRRLLIWPHGAYYFYPFHLLPTGNGRIVANDWAVASVPSLHSVVGAAPRRSGRSSVLALASSTGGTQFGLPAEPEVVQQARAVAKAFGATPLIDGDAATTGRFFAGVKAARFIHLAAHGTQYPAAPLFDAIYLSDGPLYAYQVLNLDLHGVELVTLSACESGLLRFDSSDNLHGMAAAFLRAGAAAVVGAMWPVRSEVTGTFFVELYHHIASGHGRLDAFRTAQTAARRVFPQYRDWAAFNMIGDCRER